MVHELSVSQIRDGQVLEFINIQMVQYLFFSFFFWTSNSFCRKFLGNLNNGGTNFNGGLQITKDTDVSQQSGKALLQQLRFSKAYKLICV